MDATEIKAVYADGGVIGRNPSTIGGTWAWCWVSTERRVVEDVEPWIIKRGSGIVIPSQTLMDTVSNNHSEYMALAKCLRDLPKGWAGTVYSDSAITLGRFFEDHKHKTIPDTWKRSMEGIRDRLGNVKPVLLIGHPTQAHIRSGVGKRGNPVSSFNRWCDLECARVGKAHLEGER